MTYITSKGNGVVDNDNPTYSDLFNSQNDQEKDIILVIHGGLVSKKNGKKFTDHFKKVLKPGSNLHDVHGMVWRSGPVDSALGAFDDGLIDILKSKISNKISDKLLGKLGKNSQKILKVSSKLSKKKKFKKAMYQESASSNMAIDLDKDIELIIESEQDDDLKDFFSDINEIKMAQPESMVGVIKFGVKLIINVAIRFFNGSDHGIATIQEELLHNLHIAKAIEKLWDEMKERSAGLFHYEAGDYEYEYTGPNNFSKYNIEGNANDDERAGLRYLLQVEKYQNSEHGKNSKLHIIAHSAGSINAGHLLKAISQHGLKIKIGQIFLLAPAITYWLTSRTFATHSNYEQLTILTMNDNAERNDAVCQTEKLTSPILKYLYPSSMLYVVSSMAENLDLEISNRSEIHKDIAILGMARFYDRNLIPSRYLGVDHISLVNDWLNHSKGKVEYIKVGTNENEAPYSKDHSDLAAKVANLNYIKQRIFSQL